MQITLVKAIETFNFMNNSRLTHGQEAFSVLLTALCKYSNVEEAEEYMLVNKKLFPLDTESFNIIINGWSNITTDVYEVKRIWRDMLKYSITSDATSDSHIISCFSKPDAHKIQSLISSFIKKYLTNGVKRKQIVKKANSDKVQEF